jgi:5-methyltetrahydrofolate--homocysteine methyltransferase
MSMLNILKQEQIYCRNYFSSTTIGMADYHLEDIVYELNYESAKIAREVADAFTAKTR